MSAATYTLNAQPRVGTDRCHACGKKREPHDLKHARGGLAVTFAYCHDHKKCRDAAVDWTQVWQPSLKWAVKYGVWIIIGVAFLAWELLGVKSIDPKRDHPSLSEIVWMLERKFGLPGRIVVGLFMADLSVHFLAHTPLIPGVG